MFNNIFTRGDSVDILMSNDEKYDSVFEKCDSCEESSNIFAEARLYTEESLEGPRIDDIVSDAVDNTVEDAYEEDLDAADIVNVSADELHDQMEDVADMDFGDIIDAVMES